MAAPATVALAGLKVTVATPAALVSTELAGEIVASEEAVLNVTIVLDIAAPVASFNVTVTLAGALVDIEVTGVPLLFASAMDMIGVAAGVAATPDAPVVAPLDVPTLPGPQPGRIANIKVSKKGNKNFENF